MMDNNGLDVAPIWRSGCGVVVEAIDRARAHHAKAHKRRGKALIEYDALLDQVLQMVVDATRRPITVTTYAEAEAESKAVNRIISQALTPSQEPSILNDKGN